MSFGVRSFRPGAAASPVSEDGAIEQFNEAVAKLAGPRPSLQRRQQAILTVSRRNPELYKAYMLATQTSQRARRMIEEKLDGLTGG